LAFPRPDVSHQVDDQTFVTAREDHALEARSVLPDLKLATECCGDIGKDEAPPLEGRIFGREEVQVIRRAMAEMKSGKRGAACEKETALALEERVEDLALERGQLARCGGAHGYAIRR
jgi:hypothetical protein